MREEKLLNADNVGAFYKFFNNKLGTKFGVPPLKSDLNTLFTSVIHEANLLNKYFESVFTRDDGKAPQFPCNLLNDKTTEISDIKISPQIVMKILKNWKQTLQPVPTISRLYFTIMLLPHSVTLFAAFHSLPLAHRPSYTSSRVETFYSYS